MTATLKRPLIKLKLCKKLVFDNERNPYEFQLDPMSFGVAAV
jgi:hypothetical protein